MNSRLNWRTQRNGSHGSAFDQCQTPIYALDVLYPYLRSNWLIWEPACGDGNLVKGLYSRGYQVVASDILTDQNFFEYQPAQFDAIVTNPPYSTKIEWLDRCYQLGKPFALLLPVEFMGVGGAQQLFEQFGIEIILLNRRIGFKTINTDFSQSNAWFPTCWMTSGLNIGAQLTFAKIHKRPNEQMVMAL